MVRLRCSLLLHGLYLTQSELQQCTDTVSQPEVQSGSAGMYVWCACIAACADSINCRAREVIGSAIGTAHAKIGSAKAPPRQCKGTTMGWQCKGTAPAVGQ